MEIRGRVETLTVEEPPVASHWFAREIIRIHARRVLSWHIDPDAPDGRSRDITTDAPISTG